MAGLGRSHGGSATPDSKVKERFRWDLGWFVLLGLWRLYRASLSGEDGVYCWVLMGCLTTSLALDRVQFNSLVKGGVQRGCGQGW
jgi:hypothetical protein